MKDFLSRTPFALLGAIGLLSIGTNAIDFQRDIANWIHVWKSVTHPIWEFLFGWLFNWLNWHFPWWLKDYFTMGAISSGMYARSSVYIRRILFGYKPASLEAVYSTGGLEKVIGTFLAKTKSKYYLAIQMPLVFIFWPCYIPFYTFELYRGLKNVNIGDTMDAMSYIDMHARNDVKELNRYERRLNEDLINGRILLKESLVIFYETAFYALIIIAINYALILSGVSAVAG